MLAGAAATGAPIHAGLLVRLAIAVSMLYIAGMFLNDACDEAIDRRERVDRPLPSGDVTSAEVFSIGFILLALGELVVASMSSAALRWALGLGVAIVYYSYAHKGNALGPYVMGLCRGLVYAVAAAAVSRTLTINLMIAALALALYVAALTEIAKRIGPRAGSVVPLLIAGISLVDALVILATVGAPTLAALAACGFIATLVFQRVVPGT